MIDPRRYRDPQLVRADCRVVLPQLETGSVSLVYADPPWQYSAGSPKHGRADGHYRGMSIAEVWSVLDAAYHVAERDAYLLVWVTFPILWELAAGHLVRDVLLPPSPWRYMTGGSWHKTGARQGIGFHLRGDAEIGLVFVKGRPRPHTRWLSNAWSAPRTGHSAKPIDVCASHMAHFCRPGGVVLDPWLGLGNTAIGAHRARRKFLGVEISPERFQNAQSRLLSELAGTLDL